MNLLRIQNQQHIRKIDQKFLRRVISHLIRQLLGLNSFRVRIALLDPEKMAKLNEEFLQHHGSTDVISFDYKQGYEEENVHGMQMYGEIFISLGDAVVQAKTFKTTWQQELTRYIAHGMLHLLGYDDHIPAKRKVMKQAENLLVRNLSMHFDLKKISL